MRLNRHVGALVLALLTLTQGAYAQNLTDGRLSVRSQILTIDSSRLFPETLLGQSISRAIEEERLAFARENQALANTLRAEELALTELRPTLSREEFARLAEEFDTRVQAARDDRDAKEQELEASAEAQEVAFRREVQPVLAQLMSEAGAAVLIEAENVVLRNGAVDITDIAIARINEATRLATESETDGQEPADGVPAEPEPSD